MKVIKDYTVAECRQLAANYKARAREAGYSQRRSALFSNIARSYSALASQLEMLAAVVNDDG